MAADRSCKRRTSSEQSLEDDCKCCHVPIDFSHNFNPRRARQHDAQEPHPQVIKQCSMISFVQAKVINSDVAMLA